MLDVRESGEVSGEVQQAGTRTAKKSARRTADTKQQKGKGVKYTCRMSTKGVSCFDEIEWERRSTSITDGAGAEIFRQDDVEVPSSWSMLAANVVASKYFYGAQGTDEREYSVRQLIHREIVGGRVVENLVVIMKTHPLVFFGEFLHQVKGLLLTAVIVDADDLEILIT